MSLRDELNYLCYTHTGRKLPPKRTEAEKAEARTKREHPVLTVAIFMAIALFIMKIGGLYNGFIYEEVPNPIQMVKYIFTEGDNRKAPEHTGCVGTPKPGVIYLGCENPKPFKP